MNIWKKLKSLLKSDKAPFLTGDSSNTHSPNLNEDIAEMKAEADALEKEVQEVEDRIFKSMRKSIGSGC